MTCFCADAIDFTELLRRKLKHRFVGRAAVFDGIKAWLGQADAAAASRFLLISGDPGVGKSALMAELVGNVKDGRESRLESKLGAQLLGFHICSYDTTKTLSASDFVRSVADMCKKRLPSYAAALRNTPKARKVLEEAACVADPVEAFATGVLHPLKHLLEGQWCLLVDSLDESLAAGNVLTIAELLAHPRVAAALPARLRLIATSRRVPRVEQMFRDAKVLPIHAQSERGRADVSQFVTELLRESEFKSLLTLADKQCPAGARKVGPASWLVQNVSDYADGNFLACTMILADLCASSSGPECSLRIDSLPHVPKGLDKYYFWSFSTRFGSSSGATWKRLEPLLRIVAVRGVAYPALMEVCLRLSSPDFADSDFRDFQHQISSFIVLNERGAWSFHHKSLCDWLLDVSNEYRCGHQDQISLQFGCTCLLAVHWFLCRRAACGVLPCIKELLQGHISDPSRGIEAASRVALEPVFRQYDWSVMLTAASQDLEKARPELSIALKTLREFRTGCLPDRKFGTGESRSCQHVLRQGGVYAIHSLILDWNISPDVVDDSGEPALHFFAGCRDVPVVWNRARALLERGAAVNLVDDSFNTALHIACGHDEGSGMVKLLLEFKADSSLDNARGQTPLQIALTPPRAPSPVIDVLTTATATRQMARPAAPDDCIRVS
jgi:DNA polymerase III delta prime subunit